MRTTSGYDWLWRPTRFAIYARDGWRCICCLEPVRWTGDRKGPTVDHVIPAVLGGSNDPSNLITLCRSCNSSKGITVPEELQQAFRKRIEKALRKPIDFALGRELCEQHCPGWLARKAGRGRRRRGGSNVGSAEAQVV
jgi:5-methylcytosine-specific restriction endonuclease McrA